MKNTKLTKNLNLLMICEIFFQFSDIFSRTFLVAYFYELTSQNLRIISSYYLIAYLLVGLCFWLMGDLIKTKNKLTFYRSGIIFNCLYIFSILAIGKNASQLYWLLGIVYGLSQGVYWVACHNMINSFTSTSNCKKYITSREIWLNIVKIILPFILGTSIHFSSFINVTIAILVVTFFQLLFSFFIKEENDNCTSSQSFNLLAYLSKLKKLEEKAETLYHYYYYIFFSAIVEGAMTTLITVMIMMTFSSTLDLGILTTLFSLCTVVTIYVFQRFYQKKHSKKYIYTCFIFMIFSTLILVFDINKFSVIVYNFCNAIFIIILSNIGNIQRYNSLNRLGLNNNVAEHQAFCEICLAFGRFVAYGSLFIVSFFNNTTSFSVLLFIFTLCLIPYTIHILAMEKDTSL